MPKLPSRQTTFIKYAKKNYQLEFTEEEAIKIKNSWLEVFPEIKDYLSDNNMDKLIKSRTLTQYVSYPEKGHEEKYFVWNFLGIISGKQETKKERKYTIEEKRWAFEILKKVSFPNKNKFEKDIKNLKGSRFLSESFFRNFNSVILPSGRVRGNTSYCQTRNTPFQGLAADGAKEALYELIKAGFPVINFIHDEYLILLLVKSDLKASSKQISDILVKNMRKHCPDVKVEVELEWMFNWAKKGTHTLNDAGELVPKEHNTH